MRTPRERNTLQIYIDANLQSRIRALRQKLGAKLNIGDALVPALAAYIADLEARGVAALAHMSEKQRLRLRVAELEAENARLRGKAVKPCVHAWIGPEGSTRARNLGLRAICDLCGAEWRKGQGEPREVKS